MRQGGKGLREGTLEFRAPASVGSHSGAASSDGREPVPAPPPLLAPCWSRGTLRHPEAIARISKLSHSSAPRARGLPGPTEPWPRRVCLSGPDRAQEGLGIGVLASGPGCCPDRALSRPRGRSPAQETLSNATDHRAPRLPASPHWLPRQRQLVCETLSGRQWELEGPQGSLPVVTLCLRSPGEGGFLQTAIHTVIAPSCCAYRHLMAAPPAQAPGLQTLGLGVPAPLPEGPHLLSTLRCRDSLGTAVGWDLGEGLWSER